MISEKMEALGLNRSVIREIFEYSRLRKAEIGEDRVFDFSIGNPSVEPPAELSHALSRLILEADPVALHGYTSAAGDSSVREAIAEYVRKTYSVPAEGELIYLTTGAAAAITITLHALLTEGADEEVIAFAPYFPEYKVFTEKAGGRFISLPCRESDLQVDPAALEKAITERTRVLIINSPNNPTGAVLSRKTLTEIAEVLQRARERYGHPIYILSDEPYRELVYGDAEVPYVTGIYPDTVVCYSFSKSLSIPGERIGYILVSPEAEDAARVFAAIMGAGRALGFVCATSLFQYMIPTLLGRVSDLSVYQRNRDLLYSSLTSLGFSCVRPQGAFYLFMRSPEPCARAFCERAKRHELLLVPSDDFGFPSYVRIAYCVKTEQIEAALPAFLALAREYGLTE